MIFVGNNNEQSFSFTAPSEVAARDVLTACSIEIRRQAAVMQSLDAALGAMLDLWRMTPKPADISLQMTPALLSDLQRADQLRQEIEGVARILDLLVTLETLSDSIRSQSVRACTPLLDLQKRLLSVPGPRAEPPVAKDP